MAQLLALLQTPVGSAAIVFALPFLFLLNRFLSFTVESCLVISSTWQCDDDVAVELQGARSFTEHTALVPVDVAIAGSGGSRVSSSESLTVGNLQHF